MYILNYIIILIEYGNITHAYGESLELNYNYLEFDLLIN